MDIFLPNIIRSVVTAAMFAILLITLGEPKFGKQSLKLIVASIFVFDVLLSVFFYMNGSLTALAKIDILFFLAISVVFRPFFKDKTMQWVFNCITALNVFVAVMVLSYHYSRFLPFSAYANSLLRVILFGAIILLFRRVRPLYRQMTQQWPLFVFLVLVIMVNFGYYIVFTKDIVETLSVQYIPLLLLIVLATVVYITVFYSLGKISEEYKLKEEYSKMQDRQNVLHLSVTSMRQRLSLMDEIEKQSQITRHDRRHFNSTLLELLRGGNVQEVIRTLEQQLERPPQTAKIFCENIAVNAAVGFYYATAQTYDIEFITNLDIPEDLPIESVELAIVVSNLLENAVNACKNLSDSKKRTIRFTAIFTGQLLLEIENPYEGQIATDENGYPTSNRKGHGVGTKSVVAFAEKAADTLQYNTQNSLFQVRLII